MQENHEEEQAWLARLRADDEGALDLIFQRYYPYLYRIAYHMLSDGNTAKDMVQEVMFRFWRNRASILVNSTLKGYLQRSIINQCLTHLRTKSRLVFPEETPGGHQPDPDDIQSHLETTQLTDNIQAAINALPPQCALIFRLSRFEELSYQEIARELGIAPKTVENQIGKALKILRISLKPFLNLSWPIITIATLFI
jgi:RNA polymerase sigma-70 factor (ECF subfamily)